MNKFILPMSLIIGALMLTACDGRSTYVHREPVIALDDDDADPPEVAIGEKLFHESRFSQYFFANSAGQYNHLPSRGDSVVDSIESLTEMYDSPYRGQAISCAACHFVDQAKGTSGLGMRAYTDFSRRSRIPDRGDGNQRAVRNSPNMVAMALKDGMFLHADGEFTTPEELARAGFLGRNMGWFANESKQAIHHIAEVVRWDAGTYPTDTDLAGLNYKDLFAGAKGLPEKFILPAKLRMDVGNASDEQIFAQVTRLVGAYLRSLDYSRDKDGNYNGSPYDTFLRKNGLPPAPAPGEPAPVYSQRLLQMIEGLPSLQFVSLREGQFRLHAQTFEFTRKELAGLKVFFGSGRCVQCHSAPDFTDHLFHNTGISQLEYDQVHGSGGFIKLAVPGLEERNANMDVYLPATERNPNAKSMLRSIPKADEPGRADLGVWAVFANPAMPKPQVLLRQAICDSLMRDCAQLTDAEILDLSLGLIKTPSVRDLGQSAPYFHNGQAETLQDVVVEYMKISALARAGKIRNPDPRLNDIRLSNADRENLVLFLKSLNEDYE